MKILTVVQITRIGALRRCMLCIFVLYAGLGSEILCAESKKETAIEILGGLVGHSLISLVPSAIVYYSKSENAPYRDVYFGSWIGGPVGFGGGLLLGWVLPSREIQQASENSPSQYLVIVLVVLQIGRAHV